MGVAGLWDVLRPAGQVRSLTHLSVVDGFEKNENGHRGFRLGIDASIWFYHAAYGREGENPELRTMFFRCTRLMRMPFLPLFVFDGDERPSEKRGKRITGKDHWMVQGMQSMIKAFGFEWHMAPGEAEAELAYLNRIGVIDGILSDDVDNFLFGAELVIRNPSANLSGNRAHALKNSAGKIDDQHVATYRAKDLRTREDIQLTRGGLILIGILRGGDYHQAGLTGCGVTIAHGLAKCGFGDSLYNAACSMDRKRLERFLIEWRGEIREELRTNSKGFIGRKNPSLAKSMPEDFPDIEIVLSYTAPITSETKGGIDSSRFDWGKEPDIGEIAGICELYFEWGVMDIIIKRFRTVIWPSAVLRILRRSALLSDHPMANALRAIPATPRKEGSLPAGTPSKMITRHFSSLKLSSPGKGNDAEDEDEGNLVIKIHSSRTHASTDGLLEYRLEVAPAQLIRLTKTGIRGLRTEIQKNPGLRGDVEEEDMGGDEEDGKAPADPQAHLRVWMPACMVEIAEPDLVREFTEKEAAKLEKKRVPKGSSRKAQTSTAKSKSASVPATQKAPSSGPKKSKSAPVGFSSDEEDVDSDRDVLPSLPSFETRAQVPVTKAPTATRRTVSDRPPKDASASKPPKPSKKDTQPAVKTARSHVDGFFKASKVTTSSTITKPATKVSRVASLFENVTFPESSSGGSSKANPSAARHNSSTLQSNTDKDGGSKLRTPSILSYLVDDFSPAVVPTTKAKPASTSLALKPFPMDFDNDPPASTSQSTRRKKPSLHSSESEGHGDTIHKSPRKSHSRDSPRRSSPRHTFHRDTHQRDRSLSPSPMRPRPPMSTQAKPVVKPLKYNDVIEISSDSEDELPNQKIPPPKRTQQSKRTTPRIPSPDVIDLT